MKKLLATLLMALSVTLSSANYSNPILKGMYPDPSICRVGEDYYIVNSSFQFFPGVPIFHSRDLVHWEQIGNVLDRESQLYLRGARNYGGIYAPSIRYHDGMFYMITTNVSDKGNFVVNAENPAGPWSEPHWLEFGGIDPSLFWDDDGTCWMTGTCDGSIGLLKVDPMTGASLSEPVNIWAGTGGRYPEAPHIYKKNGWYYLMLAEGGTEMGHSETIARSRNIYGPYQTNPTSPFLTHFRQAQQSHTIQGLGHADLVEDTQGKWWLVCLGFRIYDGNHHMLGRETFLAPVVWDMNGWPVVNGDGHIDLEMECETLPSVEMTQAPQKYDFSTDTLGFEWVWVRNPDKKNYIYTGKALRLVPTKLALDEESLSPTCVARRQQHINFSSQATLNLIDPSAGDEAGMSIYMDAYSHYDIFVKKCRWGKPRVQVRYRLGAIESLSKSFKVPKGKDITFRIAGSTYLYEFFYSVDGKNFRKIGAGDTKYLSTETVAGFTGSMIALYAVKASDKSEAVADFRNYAYEGQD